MKVWLVQKTQSLTIDTGGNDGQLREMNAAVAADFTLDAPAAWALGDRAILTYTGPTVTALIWASMSAGVPSGGGTQGSAGFMLSHNGDLIGADPASAAFVQAGGTYTALHSFSAEPNDQCLSSCRKVTLASGDTVQPLFGLDEFIAAQDSTLEAFTLFVLY